MCLHYCLSFTNFSTEFLLIKHPTFGSTTSLSLSVDKERAGFRSSFGVSGGLVSKLGGLESVLTPGVLAIANVGVGGGCGAGVVDAAVADVAALAFAVSCCLL